MPNLLGLYRRSLRVKVIAWSFVPASIIMGAVALVTFYSYQQVAEDLVLGRNLELTRLSASQLSSEVDQYAEILTALARTGDIYRGDPVIQRAAMERAHNRLVVFDGGVVLVDRYGQVSAAEPNRPEVIGKNWSNRPFYSQMLRSAATVYSDVVPDGPGDTPVIVVAVPVTGEQNEFQGSLVGMFRLGASAVSAFYGGLVKQRFGEGATTYLLDSSGKVIYHTDSDLIGTEASTNRTVQQLLGRKPTQVSERGLVGGGTVTSYAPVPGTPWGLMTEESWDRLMSPGEGYRRYLIVLLVLGVIGPALVVTAGVQRILGPVAQMNTASREVAGGNFERTIEVRTGDELEELANQFNAMSSQLQDSYANLERKVADRTKELAALNSLATVVSGSLELEEVLHAALDKTLEVMGLDKGGIYLLDDERSMLSLAFHRGITREDAAAIDNLEMGEGFSGHVAESGEPLVVADTSLDPRLSRTSVVVPGASLACVPVCSKGVVLGTLFVESKTRREFTSQDLQLLSSIGHQVGVAVENARLYERARLVAVLEERNRLSRDLHDSVTQAVYGVTLYAEAASRMLAAGEIGLAKEHLVDLRDTGQQALREVRSLIFELRPSLLEQEGLVAALRARLEAVESRAGLAVELDSDGVQHLPPAIEDGLYGIAQEALNNALKHSKARGVRVHLGQAEGKVVLEVSDDGEGFDPSGSQDHRGLGMKGMEERATALGGRLSVTSAPKEGTTVRVEVEL